jgi:hypothetical protein
MEAYEAARTLTMDQAALVTMGGHEGDGRPIPLMNIASARYGSRTVSSSRSGWLNNTMLSLVPWMKSSGGFRAQRRRWGSGPPGGCARS